MTKKILITGSNGQMGQEFKTLASNSPHHFFFTDHATLDITKFTALEDFFKKNPIDIIINCAAYTAVDDAESNRSIAKSVNADAVENLVKISNHHDVQLFHISTDFVYDGFSSIPYVESDITNPLSVYGQTKLEGENIIVEHANDYIIIRTSWLYSSFGHNFVKTMQRLGRERQELNIIFDQIGTPTYAKDLAQTILLIIDKQNSDPAGKNNIYHYSNEGVASWYDFAQAIMEYSGIECEVNPIETKDYPTPAKRPAFSVMNKAKIKAAYAIQIPYWRDSLKTCIKRINTPLSTH